ncbi:hypothetical protein V8D89_004931 [Ganoderma adspersum]
MSLHKTRLTSRPSSNCSFVNTSLNFAAIALVFYEYIITLQDEVAYFWGRRFTCSSFLFYSNRYLVLAYSVALLGGTGSFTKDAKVVPPSNLVWKSHLLGYPSSCSQWSNGVRAMEILSYVPWAALSSLRVYALSRRALSLAVPVFILSIVPVCINFADFRWTRFVSDTLWGCSQAVLESSRLSIMSLLPCPTIISPMHRTVTIVSRISLIVADLVVIVTTWTCTFCFVTLLLLNVLHLAFCASSVVPSSPGSHISDVVVFIEPITSILMSRFMLGLQAAIGRTSAYSESDAPANATSLTFEKVVGSLAVTRSSSSFSSYADAAADEDDEDIAEDGDPWCADGVVAAPRVSRERSWENPFADVEAAGTASLTDFSTTGRFALRHRGDWCRAFKLVAEEVEDDYMPGASV